ncbi:MAG: phenylalanine--tRNA ligase subunit beta [Candidatus Bathyarchaeia archaeon]
MPTVEVNREDFEALLGFGLPKDPEELNDILAYVKGETKYFDEQEIHIEIKDSNRADLWSVEGLVRALKGFLNFEKGLKNYDAAGSSGVEIWVDARLKDIRPFIACAIIKNVELNDIAIRQIMHLQDKMDQTYGRQRKRTSIGLYNFDLVNPPLRYGVAKPEEISFVPLEFEEKLTLREILQKHPKGVEYGHIVQSHPFWPIFMDSEDRVLSFPPIINSNDLGRVTEDTRNVLIEVTGTVYKTVLNTLTNVTLALADRGGKIHSVKVHYPYENMKEAITPELKGEILDIDVEYIWKVIGMKLNPSELKDFLERARYGVIKTTRSKITVEIPCYRVDVMHPIDVVEDIAIAHNYNRMQPRWPQLLTIGGVSSETKFSELVREVMVGLGFQEILSFSLSNPETLFIRMNLKPERVVEIANPKVSSMVCLRSWLLPSLMEFLSRNIHVEYPQKIFEVGYCVVHEEKEENKTRDIEKLACVTMHSNASFTEAKSMLEAFLMNLGLRYELEEMVHGSFIEGRTGRINIGKEEVGFIGEIHPQVLQNWNLENPAAAFEINLNKLKDFFND